MSKLDSKKRSKTNWENFATMPDSAINLADSPELDASFFENAELRLPKPKKAVSLRLDDDIFNWFRHQGKGYQTRINAVLRLYVQARSRLPRPSRSSLKHSRLRRTSKSAQTAGKPIN
jgi:uncharacterized protein (DUF4415 family)